MTLLLTSGVILIGIFLFVKNYFSIDTTSILIMALFIVSGVLSPEEGFSGFNHPATLTLGCMFVVSSGIFRTGLIDGVSDKIVSLAKIHYLVALLVFCVVAATFSAFINDAAVVALLIPMALMVSRETGISPSKLLIPISFSALFGGTCTLIGTSTNILVSSYAGKAGLEPFGMFEFSGLALCLLAIGVIYLFVASPFLLPNRKGGEAEPTLAKQTEQYIAEIVLLAGTKEVEKRLAESDLVSKYGVQVLSLERGHEILARVDGNTHLLEGDKLKVLIEPEKLSQLKASKTYGVAGDGQRGFEGSEEKQIFEVMIPFGSDLAGNNLRSLNFRNQYRSSVLAYRHRNESKIKDLSNLLLREGDMLLIYGSAESIGYLVEKKMVVLLSEYKKKQIKYRKAIPALLIALGVVFSAALGLTSILISGMIGALLLVTLGIIKPKEAYEAIDWKVIFMMAGVLSMGKALEKSGGSDLISQFIFTYMGDLAPQITLSALFLVTMLSTNVLSSKASAALMAPIVISLAQAMQVSERPFLIAIMFACSLTFMTPVSYPTNTMVYSPGNYTFKDYLIIGTPLNIIIWLAATLLIPLFFPF